jgi:hypothetical protein
LQALSQETPPKEAISFREVHTSLVCLSEVFLRQN